MRPIDQLISRSPSQNLASSRTVTSFLLCRVEARVWDEDVRNAAANIRDIRSLEGFTPSSAWLNDFKYRHEFETDPNDGSIVSSVLAETEDDPAA